MSSREWKEVRLGDIVDSISEKHKFNINKIVLVNTSDVLKGKVLNHEYVPNRNLKGQFKKCFKKDDILYSEIRPRNKRFAYVDFDSKDYVASTKLMVLRKKNDGITSKFLYYVLSSDDIINKLQIIAESRSGTFPQITFAELARMDILLPPISEQKAIAATLSCLDDKIELNNRINKTLEEIAQAIFKSWFVDFEPFQDGEFEDSELGRIPKGWRVGVLDEITELFDSKRIPLSSRERKTMQKTYPYYGAASLMDYVDDYIFDGIYVLLGEDGTVVDSKGYPILQYVWGKFWVNNHAHVLKGKNGFNEDSIYMLLKNTNMQGIVTGAVQPKINQTNLKSVKVVIPPHNLLSKFNRLLEPLFAEKRRGSEENLLLVDIRDTLLPKLMSGEIRVPIEGVQ